MFNVTIIKLKDIIKIGIILILIYVFSNFIFKNFKTKSLLNTSFNLNSVNFVKTGIERQSNIIKYISKEELRKETNEKINNNANIELSRDTEEDKDKLFDIESILNIGANVFTLNQIKDLDGQDNINVADNNNIPVEKEEKKEETLENAEEKKIAEDTNITTEVVTANPLAEKYNRDYNGVKIKNETEFELTDDILNPEGLSINKNNIIIFHTHTCESYTQSEKYYYEPTGSYRTTDLNCTIARVGDELENNLKTLGFNVNHNKTYHDYPAYTGSYSRSLATVKGILNNFNSDIIIDLHRDAIGNKEDYAPLVKIGNDYCAQLMFVMGTNGGGLTHSNWDINLKFAVRVQQKANEKYPGLFKTMIVRNSRYNQHLGKAACIIEVGATGNTLDQAINSMKYLANVINEGL